MSASLPEAVIGFLRASDLLGAGTPAAEALPGGVSSEIWRVETPRGSLCVKRALPRLRVAQVWEAPVERNHYESEWFKVAAAAVPGAAPQVLASGEGLFAMEYLPPERYAVWKGRLSQGDANARFAAQVGSTLGRIHAATARRPDVAQRFATDRIFYDLRLEPYLVSTGREHPDLQANLASLVERTAGTRRCLVHGDVSPKNILCGPDGPVFLDAECAWYGDPAFDLAFCLNHLLLKCLWVPASREAFLECYDALSDSYLRTFADIGLEDRAASLLPALLLARVDGKSPVEYLTEERQKHHVRKIARQLVARPPVRLKEIRDTWRRSLM